MVKMMNIGTAVHVLSHARDNQQPGQLWANLCFPLGFFTFSQVKKARVVRKVVNQLKKAAAKSAPKKK